MNPNDHTEAYIDGHAAAFANAPRSANPYCYKRNIISWERGYNAGLKELSRQQEQARKASKEATK